MKNIELTLIKYIRNFPLNLGLGIGLTTTRAKAQRTPSSEKIGKYFSLRAWRLGAINFVEVVLLNILLVRN